MQSINSIKAYAYGLNKYLAYKNEEIKCNIKKKQYKKWLTLMILREKT